MKKTGLFLIVSILFPIALSAQGELSVYENAYIWGQSARNTSKKGSAIELYSGKTFSLGNVVSKTSPDRIDLLCYWGKVGKTESNFYFFAPGNNATIDWTPKDGTRPYCDMIGSPTSDPEGATSLKSWPVRNATKLQILNPKKANFDEATFESINAMTLPQNSFIVNNLRVNDIILFETAATSAHPGKKGLIKIVSIEDDPEKPENAGKGSNQKLNLIIKVQK
jgi:hypothetical protein